ncbi:MAG: transporter [Bacteroidia bacterium]|nr:transporter [Bacteroidia bacterium]NNF31373.1 transporter [Flavobacteriaceae bacterium]MBT8276551.1 transporter [Bacteroidia bacterium]NNJ81477.1 transporter [Flavobacteriaceae bacterium]NNK54353.1 transporter [Flavobacteriaceae bacterium]
MTRIKILFLAALFLVNFGTISAQYTDMINTNRPGVSQGAFSVGKNVLQFETGFSYGKEDHRLLSTETNVWAIDYSVRYGFFREELEVSLIGIFQSNNITDTRGAVPFEFTQSNFRSNTLGAKYLIYDPYRKMEEKGPNLYSWKKNFKFQWADLIPAVSVYAGANFDFSDNPFTPEPETTISPKVVVSTQNNLVGGFVFVTNIIADRITTDFPSYGYIITLTHATNDYFSIFLENQGFKSDFYADQLLRGGAAALINANLHVDASVTLNFKDTPSVFYGRIGVAYRFDMHGEDEYIEEKGKSGRKKKRAEKGTSKKKNKRKNRKRKDDFIEDDGDGGGLQF